MKINNHPSYNPNFNINTNFEPSAPPYYSPKPPLPPSYLDSVSNNVENVVNKNIENIENKNNKKSDKKIKKRNAKTEFRKYSGMKLEDFNYNERKELLDYGKYLGVNLYKYPFCLEYVLDSINAPLPRNWEQHTDENHNIYYYCRSIDKSSWEHPADPFYKEVVRNEIKKYKREKKIIIILLCKFYYFNTNI